VDEAFHFLWREALRIATVASSASRTIPLLVRIAVQ